MNISENLTLLAQTKENIRQAIITMGGTVEASAPFSTYPQAILAIPTGGTSIPEGLHKFAISQSQWPDYAMAVEADYNPDDVVDMGVPGSQTVNIYTDPSGEPVNSITYNCFANENKLPEMNVQNTNYAAGVYCTQTSDWVPYITNPIVAFKLECSTAGTYYIEVVDHTNPRFYDANGNQIYPDNA